MLAASSSLDQQFVQPPSGISEIKITSDMLLRIKGETDTEWAERLVENKLSARFIEQKTGIPRSRIAKWPSYRAIRDQENQIKANKILGRQKAVQLFSEKEIIKHKDLIVISKNTGIPTGTLRRMDEYKARRPEKQKKAALQDKEKAKQLLKEGQSVRKIAKETNVAERTLHQWKGNWKKIKVSSDASSSSTTEQTLITQISDMKKKRRTEENIAPVIQKKMKKMLSAATDELDPYTRDCTTTAIGVDGNEKYYISSSSYPFPLKLQRWAKKNNINIIDAQGHAEESMINNVGNIKHIEPSRNVCLECEHKMLKHHVTTSTSFSHKLSRARRIENNPTEEMIVLSKKLNAAEELKEKNKCEAKRLLTEGKLSLAEIERDTGVRKSTMVGWQEHKTWLSSRKQLKADDPRKAEAVQMSRKGISQNEIAKKLKTSKTKVSLWIKEFKQDETRQAPTKPSTSGKKTSSHAGGKPSNTMHMQLSLRSEIRAESGVISQRGLTRWIQEPGMNNCSYQEVLSVLEDEEIDFDVNDFIKAWTAAGRTLPGE
nr:helix-turn-helix domain-containing protein [Trabulsiella odontotermitis]